MCSRFRSIRNLSFLTDHYEVASDDVNDYIYNPNVAPTNRVPILRSEPEHKPAVDLARFGIKPAWMAKAGTDGRGPSILLNARVETIHTKRTFQRLLNKRRCAVPVEGYYEWRTEEGVKQPYLFTRKDGEIMWLAGLWDMVKDASHANDLLGEAPVAAPSFLIITGEPNSLASPVHDRMPCIIDADAVESWLNMDDLSDADLIIYPSELMDVRPVNRAMNRSSVKNARLIDAA